MYTVLADSPTFGVSLQTLVEAGHATDGACCGAGQTAAPPTCC